MIQVQKRNGKVVEYDSIRIINAILKAIREAEEGSKEDAIELEKILVTEVLSKKDFWAVDEIQNEIEKILMKKQFFNTAKTYILYRKNKENIRDKKKKNTGLLSDEFLSKYKHSDSPMTELGELVYYRTYSRFLEELGRREYWWETVKRAVEYNCSLIRTTKEEAELLFDNMFNLRQFLSGRTLWVGNTDVALKYPMANYNCSFQNIDDFEAFADVFYVLMIGSGAGIRVLKDDVVKLPKIRTNVTLINKDYEPVPKQERSQSTSLLFADNMVEITVGDSKEGWVQSLSYFLRVLWSHEYKHIDTIIINYDHVRPKGERLKTFGGTASGHTALAEMFVKIDKIFKKHEDELTYKLKPVDCMDICNMIGEGVVVGGVRRTSEVVLMDTDDEESIQAKDNLYTQANGKWTVSKDLIHRQMSNNSIFHKKKPTRDKLHWQLQKMRYSGEPGLMNAEAAEKRRPNFAGGNPCMEILLDSKGLCNLTTLNVYAFVENGKLKREELLTAQRLSARASYRMTNVELELPKWDAVQKRDRLTGCSLTGWQDMVNAVGMTKKEEAELLKELRKVAHEETKKLADQIGAEDSLLVTTVKPEGSLSQLPTVSSGVHYSHSPFYIRRVRINANDPLVKVCEELGYPMKPEVGQEWETCSTKVIEFPVQSPNGKTKYEVSAIEQLENYKMFMENYTDHNVSITVHVRDHEWEGVEEWVWNNWDSIVAVSFLSLDDNFYELLPYESITEEEYNSRRAALSTRRITPERIAKYEKHELTIDLGNDGCDTGVCPVR